MDKKQLTESDIRANELRALCADLRERLKKTQSVQVHLADALVGI